MGFKMGLLALAAVFCSAGTQPHQTLGSAQEVFRYCGHCLLDRRLGGSSMPPDSTRPLQSCLGALPAKGFGLWV